MEQSSSSHSTTKAAHSTTKAAVPRHQVAETVRSRYLNNRRPASWDERVAGVDLVKTTDGQTLKLQSDGMQSPPQKGWIIELIGGNSEEGFKWTLYGIPPGADL